MASTIRTKLPKLVLIILLINITKTTCNDDIDSELNLDDSKTEQILKDDGDVISDTDVNNYDSLDNVEAMTESVANTDVNEVRDDATTVTDAIETSEVFPSTTDIYKHVDTAEEINSNYNDEKAETTSQSTTRSMDEEEQLIEPEESDVTGQRNPKTDNSEPQLPDLRTYIKPPPQPAASKSSTLRGWLEDTWLRPPAGILVPLRPIALNRALDVWKDLTVEGLNVSDIVIVGYDSNGVNWRSRHNLQAYKPSTINSKDRDVSDALSKLLLKYQGVHSDTSSDGTMRALASAAKLVPYDSALFVITDKGAGDPQRLPLALRALVEKRLKVYTIWTDPAHPSADSEEALQELRNISKHTEGDVLPYHLKTMDVESPSNLASEMDLQSWEPADVKQARRGRVNMEQEFGRFDTLLLRRGAGEALSLGLPIESGVTALKILIEGAVEHAVLYPPNDAPQIDLYNTSSVSAFSPTSRTDSISPREVYLVFPGASGDDDMLSVVPASPPAPQSTAMVGVWHLSVRCDTCDYRLRVTARAAIHLDVETHTADTARIRVTGPVASVRESQLVDELGNEIAKLMFSYQPIAGDGDEIQPDPVTELVTDIPIPAYKGSKVYVKIVGRDFQGDPFVRLSGPLSQPEIRLSRSAALTIPDANDLETMEEENVAYSRLRYNDSNVLPTGRAASQVVNQYGSILTAVQIGLSTRLYGSPGDNLQLHFEVTNYREQSVSFRFGAVGELRFLTSINPSQQTIQAGQTVNVIVSLTISTTAQAGARDLITFTAYGLDQVSISAYVYVMNPTGSPTDVWAPEVRHNFQGSCIGRQGQDCAQYVWSATVIARDATGGLLRLSSSPVGLVYDSNFISGSREEVVATYRATCCVPRVIVTAVDSFGNVNSYVVDISNYFSNAAIAAIVLGVLLAIALIILVVYLIYWCVRRRKESRELPYSTSSRNIS